MQDDLLQLYSAGVIDHLRNPRNPHDMDEPDGHAKVSEPCGDTIELFLRAEGSACGPLCARPASGGDATIAEASFVTQGCLTTFVSASAAVELVTGKTAQQALGISAQQILDALGGLPEHNEHCADLAVGAIRGAVTDLLRTRKEPWKRLYRQR